MKKKNTIPGNHSEENKQTPSASQSRMGKTKAAPRQVAAILGVALLVLLYLVSLIASIIDSSASAAWFRASLFGTVALPLLIWVYVWLYGKLTGKHTIADAPENDEASDTP